MNKRYYMFNKPNGCVTARTDEKQKTVMDYFEEADREGLSPVGRLDKDTKGLLFVTDDGKWLNYMTDPKNGVRKKYFFWALGEVDEMKMDEIQKGVSLTGMEGKLTRPAIVEITDRSEFGLVKHLVEGNTKDKILKNRDSHPVFSGYITVTEGRKHEVRRLIKYAGGCVFYLERVMMGDYVLDENLLPGEYKEFFPTDIRKFQEDI